VGEERRERGTKSKEEEREGGNGMGRALS